MPLHAPRPERAARWTDSQSRSMRGEYMRASSLRRRLPMLALTLSVAAAVVLGGPIGGVATAKTSHHHKVAPKILELGGTWTGSYTGKRRSAAASRSTGRADKDEAERIAQAVQPGRQIQLHRHDQRQQHPLRRRQRRRQLHRFGFERGQVDVGQLDEPGGRRQAGAATEVPTLSRDQRRSLRSRRLRRPARARATPLFRDQEQGIGVAGGRATFEEPMPLSGLRFRHRGLVGLASIAAAALGVRGFSRGRWPRPPGPPAACQAHVAPRLLPMWARAGFSSPRPLMPYVLGERGEIAAIQWADPLVSPPSARYNNKILWVSQAALVAPTRPRPPDQRPEALSARHARRARPSVPTVTSVTRPGHQPPSAGCDQLNLPSAGCWHLRLRWSGRSDTLDLRYAT